MADVSDADISTKLDIRRKIETGEYIVTDQERKLSTKSACWKSFKVIKVAATNEFIGYVRCAQCKSISKYNSARTGTSHLLKHLARCDKGATSDGSGVSKVCRAAKGKAAAAVSKTLTQFLTKPIVNRKQKKRFTNAAVMMCTLDMRPFEMVHGVGFELFCKEVIDFTVQNGSVDAKSLIPHPTTVSRNTKIAADNLRRELIPLFIKMINDGFCAATTDMWTDDYKKVAYTTVTLHYTDSVTWRLVRKVLFTCAWPLDKKKTAVNIKEELTSKFKSLGFDMDAIHKNVVFVTDQGTNIVKALEPPFQRMNCCAHLLNTILRNIFKPKVIAKVLPQVHKTFVAAKALVAFLKHTGLSSQLKCVVVQEVETRWNSRLLMLKSVLSNYNEISKILTEGHHDLERLHAIRLPILKVLIEFLEPFKTASDALESDSSTINCVLPEYHELLNFCTTTDSEDYTPQNLYESDDDQAEDSFDSDNTEDDDMGTTSRHIKSSEILQYLKKQAYYFLKTKFIICEKHKLATLLTPILKGLGLKERAQYPGITMQERQQMIEHLRMTVYAEKLLAETRADFQLFDSQPTLASPEIFSDNSNIIPGTSVSDIVPKKKKKTCASTPTSERLQFLLSKALPEPVEEDIEGDEVDLYLKIKCDPKTDSDALNWWRNRMGQFPILSTIARKLLCIPASSASSERVFSAAGYIVQERRSCLSPHTVDSILFLNSNSDMKQRTIDELIDSTETSEGSDSE